METRNKHCPDGPLDLDTDLTELLYNYVTKVHVKSVGQGEWVMQRL